MKKDKSTNLYSIQIQKQNMYREASLQQLKAQINLDSSVIADNVELHTHTFYEILFVCKGNDVQYLLNNNRYQLKKWDLLIIPPTMAHRPLFLKELIEPYERFALWIEPDFFESYCNTFSELGYAFEQCRRANSWLLRGTKATGAGFYAGFNSLWQEQEGCRFAWQAAVANGAINLMMHISRTFYYRDTCVAETEIRSLFDDAFSYIDTNLCSRLTLESVAEHFHVSKSTVSHLFQKQLGVSFYHCVIQRRLIRAKNSILQGAPLFTVWEKAGFSDYSSFYRLFKKEYGISPREFRSLNGTANN